MTLEQVLADWRGDAAVLRRQGHEAQALLLERHAETVTAAARDYLTWLSEAEAQLHAGKTVAWLRGRFPALEADGNAKRDGRRRIYRLVALPHRADPGKAYREGRSAA